MRRKINSIFQILVFVMAVLVFSMSIAAAAQHNSELVEAVIAAEQDAKAEVDQDKWWWRGCLLVGVAAADSRSQPPPERLVGKSPEYVEVYTQAYQAKVRNLRKSAAVPGCLTTVFSTGILIILLSALD